MSKTQAERITALEVQVEGLRNEIAEMNKNLSDLVALRNKGAGAFWLGTTLFGTSLILVVSYVINWLRG